MLGRSCRKVSAFSDFENCNKFKVVFPVVIHHDAVFTTKLPGGKGILPPPRKKSIPEKCWSQKKIGPRNLMDAVPVFKQHNDSTSKKIPSSEIKDISQKNAYQSCSTADPVFIHPASAMFDKLPDYLVYQEIIETSKLYMKGVTAIEENWLPVFAPYLCTFSKPLESLKPSYDIKSGRMKCHMTSTYGPHSWTLPAQELDFPPCIERFKWFATAFLSGQVSQSLKEFVPYLLAPASVMTKSWSRLHPRTEVLLQTLVKANVFDKKSLMQAWKENSNWVLANDTRPLKHHCHADSLLAMDAGEPSQRNTSEMASSVLATSISLYE
eukprot:gene15559-6824_t